MNAFNTIFGASPDSIIRANTSRKGFLYSYDPGPHHNRFSPGNMKTWKTKIYESFYYYDGGDSFAFITSDTVGSEPRKFTVFSTSDGGYSLTRAAQADTKAKAEKIAKEAVAQVFELRVAEARKLADKGDFEKASKILYDLAVSDKVGDIGYAVRMRYHEIVGAIERAGFDLKSYFKSASGRAVTNR